MLEKLINLPILKRHGEQFSLDLQTIKIHNGAIDYLDGRKPAGLGEWRLRQADVTVERVRGQRLREFMKDLLARPSAESTGAALHFEINSQVEKDHAPMQLKASGRLVFPQEVLDFHQAHWNADVDLVDFPAALIKVQLGAHLPIKSASGHLAQRLHLEGYPEKQLRLKGDIEFRKISIDAPELLARAANRRERPDQLRGGVEPGKIGDQARRVCASTISSSPWPAVSARSTARNPSYRCSSLSCRRR